MCRATFVLVPSIALHEVGNAVREQLRATKGTSLRSFNPRAKAGLAEDVLALGCADLNGLVYSAEWFKTNGAVVKNVEMIFQEFGFRGERARAGAFAGSHGGDGQAEAG